MLQVSAQTERSIQDLIAAGVGDNPDAIIAKALVALRREIQLLGPDTCEDGVSFANAQAYLKVYENHLRDFIKNGDLILVSGQSLPEPRITRESLISCVENIKRKQKNYF